MQALVYIIYTLMLILDRRIFATTYIFPFFYYQKTEFSSQI